MTDDPRVSIIVPNYNRARLIGETIESMARQTLQPYEIIVVDDGSTDDSREVIRGFGRAVTLIEQSNSGPGAARNAGLAVASGEYIQFFDSDDLCSPDKIERQARALQSTGADIAYGPWVPVRLQAGKAIHDGMTVQQHAIGIDPIKAMLRGWVCFIPCCLMRRSLLNRLGGYPTATRTGEDLELFFKALLAGARLVHVPDGLVLVRQHATGQLSANPEGAEMRVRDRLHLLRLMEAELSRAGTKVNAFDGLLLRAALFDAQRELKKFDRDAKAAKAPAAAKNRFFPTFLRARQHVAGLRRRLTGSRLQRFFGPAPLTAAQLDRIRAIGYEPFRNPELDRSAGAL